MGARARDEQGFGLIELLIALIVLSIGILALFGAFEAGALTIRRAAHVSTAAALADKQMEGFRAMAFTSVGVVGPIPSTQPYITDPAYNNGAQFTVPSPCSGTTDQCEPSFVPNPAPDGYSYEVDTYVVCEPTAVSADCTTGGQKDVTVIVYDGKNLTGRPLTRETSTFFSSGA